MFKMSKGTVGTGVKIGENIVKKHVLVSGKVQGVFYRKNTQKTAIQHLVKGWVRNRYDGRVEAVFEGKEDNVNKVLQWCREGPRKAIVQELIVTDQHVEGLRNFKVLKNA